MFYSLANPGASSGECAHCSFSTLQFFVAPVAKENGAQILERPVDLARDNVSTLAVLQDWEEKRASPSG